MRLSKELNGELFSEETIQILNNEYDVYTVQDFLSKSDSDLIKLANGENKLNVENVLKIRAYCVQISLPKLNTPQSTIPKFKTGIREIDELIDFKTGYIYEIYGPPSSFKTQICLQMTSQNDRNTIIIDTKNEITSERLFRTLERSNDPSAEKRSKKDIKFSLKNEIKLYKTFNLDEIFDVLYNLKAENHLIIIDNVTNPILSELDTEGIFNLIHGSFVDILRSISINNCVLFINNYIRNTGKPSLGKYLNHAADIRILLENKEDSFKLSVNKTLMSYNNPPVGAHCLFNYN